jgi:hypothetical protein
MSLFHGCVISQNFLGQIYSYNNSRIFISGGNFDKLDYPRIYMDDNSFINYEFKPNLSNYTIQGYVFYPTLLNDGEKYITAQGNTYLRSVMIPQLQDEIKISGTKASTINTKLNALPRVLNRKKNFNSFKL